MQEIWVSPTIAKLQQELEADNQTALAEFWQNNSQKMPLIEPATESPGYSLVTFVWKASEALDNVVLFSRLSISKSGGFALDQLTQLPGTDLWYRTYRVKNNHLSTYWFSPNDPLTELSEIIDWVERGKNFQPDPLNPHTYLNRPHPTDIYGKDTVVSVLELPEAPSRVWAIAKDQTPAGEIIEHSLTSQILNNQRPVWVYTPPGYNATENCNLVVLFDGWAYLNLLSTPVILDNLLNGGNLGPTIAVMVDYPDFPTRNRELPCYSPFAEFVAEELIPWINENYRVTADPTRRVVGGLSYGGLAAAYLGLQHSELFGNVLCQSGSFWWKPGIDQGEGENEEHEWLARQYATNSELPLRFYLEVGVDENGPSPQNGPSQLVVNRHMRNVLEAKGYSVTYHEFSGGHEFVCWQRSLAQGLLALFHK